MRRIFSTLRDRVRALFERTTENEDGTEHVFLDPPDEEGQAEQPKGAEMNALMCMREHIGRHMRGEDSETEMELDSVITPKERAAMTDTPFGRINDMIGALSGYDESEGEKSLVQPPPVFKFTRNQFGIMEVVHNRFLSNLFNSNAGDLAEVYLRACSEDEYEAFMADFPTA